MNFSNVVATIPAVLVPSVVGALTYEYVSFNRECLTMTNTFWSCASSKSRPYKHCTAVGHEPFERKREGLNTLCSAF